MVGRGQASLSDRLLGKALRPCLYLSDRNICCKALRSAMERLPAPETAKVIDRFEFPELRSLVFIERNCYREDRQDASRWQTNRTLVDGRKL